MKTKILLLTIAATFFLSCSKDDDGGDSRVWGISIRQFCPPEDGHEPVRFCVSKEEHDEVMERVDRLLEEPCIRVTFVDLKGVERSGWFHAGGYGLLCD